MKNDVVTINKMQSSKVNLKVITLTAMFAALITVATAFIKVPTMFGYKHAGDSMLYIAACVLPFPYGIIASSIGGGLADLISGYPQWILPTAIIKALNAVPFVICRLLLAKKNKDNKIICLPLLIMLIPTALVTVFGYCVANYLMYGWAAATAELATEWVQPLVGSIIYVFVGLVLDKINFKSKVKKLSIS